MSNPGSTLLTPDEVFGPKPPDTPASPATALSGPAPKPAAPHAQGATISPEEAFGAPTPGQGAPDHGPDFFGVAQAAGSPDLYAALGADFIRQNKGNGSSTPALDNFFEHTPAGHILKAFGEGVAAPSRVLDELTSSEGEGPETIKFLKAAGVYEPFQKAHDATDALFRNGTLRPLATAADYARGMFRSQTSGAAQAWWSGVASTFDQLRQDLISAPDATIDPSLPWEAKFLPYMRQLVNKVPLGTSAVAIFDAANVGFALTGIPQLIGSGAHQLAAGWVNAVDQVIPRTPNMPPKATQIRDLEAKINFAAMFAAPARGALPLETRLADAQHYGVIKPPPTAEDDASGILQKTRANADQMKENNIEPPQQPRPGTPKQDLQPSHTAPEPAPTPVRDVHAVAREIAPDVFVKYDPLQRRDQWYNSWISELRAARDNDPRIHAAQGEIDTILGKVAGKEERLTGRARERLEDLRGYIDDFRAVDSPDMVRVKQEKLANYQAMQDLLPQVRAAYSQAADHMAHQMPETAPEVVEPMVAPPPAPVPVPVAEAAPQPRTDLAPETAHIQTPDDIAADISRQMQAAGRPKEEADATGAVVASHYEARAARFGGQRGTAAELYREGGLSIQGQGRTVPGQRTFAQRALDRTKDLVQNVPGLKSVLPHLSEDERGILTKRLATKLSDVFSELPSAHETASVAYAGRIKRGWYKNAAQTIRQLFGEDSDRFSALLASMSPQTSVETNLLNALKTWTAWEDAGRPTDPKTITRIIGENVEGTGGEASALPAWIPNSLRSLTSEDPGALNISGPKVNSFMQNLRGHVDEVTNDAWMATYAALEPELLRGRRPKGAEDQFGTLGFKGPGYMAVSAMVRRAAKILSDRTGETWTPAEVQETVWSWAKTLYEKRDSAGEDRITRDILKAGDLTHEDILNTPDFASMLIRGVYRKILEEGGYGSELQNVEQSLAERLAVDRETGAAGDVTRAEGAGIAQAAFERHLQRAADRLESVIAARREGVTYGQSATGAEAGELSERGGVSGGAVELASPGGAREAYDRGEPLAGLPRKATIPGVGSVDVGPIQRIRDTADAYMKSIGRDHTPVMTYVKVNPQVSREIAAAFDEMKDDPENPEVKRAYEAMARETLAQWEFVKKTGLKVEFFKPENDPYAASPRLAIQDIKDRNHLWVFSTDDGYGETPITARDIAHNPMLAPVPGETISGRTPRINDIFRIVHDFFGHAQEGNGFRADGEENAWRVHSTMYSPEARRAMTTETRGQNSWLNYGPYGETNRSASTAETVFADQKVGLLPEWVSETNVRGSMEQGGRRASITFRNGMSIVRLLKSADASSAIHEIGHHLLEELFADAKHELAPQDLRDDAATARDWLGIKEGDEIPRRAHEQFARGFERYVMEGIAPNRALASVFAKFKQWMLRIYKSVQRLNTPLNDDVRGVFDRLVAEPEQRTVIAPERSAARQLADVHEIDAQTTPPEHAALAADHIRSEIDQTLLRISPELHNALPHKSAGQASPIQGAHPLPAGGADEAGAQPGNAGEPRPSGAIAEGRNGAAQTSAVVRSEPSGAGGPAGGEHGATEPVAAVESAGGERGFGAGQRGGLEFIEGTGAPTVSEFSRNMEARAILAGMPPDFFGELPTHGVMSKADQTLRAVNLLHDDPKGAMAIAMAERDPPPGLMRPFVVKAIENRARMEGDWETLRQLGTNQKLADERTTIGRQLGAMAEQDATDPVAAIRTVMKSRAAKVKDVQKVTGADVTAMKDAIRKAPSKAVWNDFVTSITCK